MDTKSQAHMDLLLSTVENLSQNLVAVDVAEAGQIARQLRSVNGKIWGIINTLEAHNLQHLYDLHEVVRAIARGRSEAQLGDTWVSLVADGALRINPKRLLDEARAYNIDIEEYANMPEGEI